MSFFQKAFGFEESDYATTQKTLAPMLTTIPDKDGPAGWQRNLFKVPHLDRPLDAGVFRFDSVAELRAVAKQMLKQDGYTAIAYDKGDFTGDSRELHSTFPNGTFQAASQFNCLEFVSQNVTPERGITCYQNDRTQGPACAIACAAGTAFRNYFVPVADNLTLKTDTPFPASFQDGDDLALFGQRENRQLNGLADVEALLREKMDLGDKMFWRVKNGYIELEREGQDPLIHLQNSFVDQPDFRRQLVDSVRVGCHFDTEVTDVREKVAKTTTQVFASACSIGYSRYPDEPWRPIAQISLDGAYEATFYAHIIHAIRQIRLGIKPGNVSPLFLTKLGGGVFSNPTDWIVKAMIYAQERTNSLFAELAAEAATSSPQQQKQEDGAEQQKLAQRASSGADGEGEAPLETEKTQEGQPEEKKDNNQNDDAAVAVSTTTTTHVRPPFKFDVLITHFREVERGYESFSKP